jgi:hypothetical protein
MSRGIGPETTAQLVAEGYSRQRLIDHACHADMVHGIGKPDVTGTTTKEYQAEADRIQAHIDAAIREANGG